jgi:hypothetical protein
MDDTTRVRVTWPGDRVRLGSKQTAEHVRHWPSLIKSLAARMLKRRTGLVGASLTGRWIDLSTPLLVTSASGANGYGALLAFDQDGKPLGRFSDDNRVVDPRGLAAEPRSGLLFINSAERVLALDPAGKVVRDTGVIAGNPGGGVFWAGRPVLRRPARRSDGPGVGARFEEPRRTGPGAWDRTLSSRIWVQRPGSALQLFEAIANASRWLWP